MAKTKDGNSPDNIEHYEGSSAASVWIILAVSTALVVVAVVGASSIV